MTNYNKEVVNILKNSEREAICLHHPFVGTEHIILSILNSNTNVKKILNYYNITYTNYKNMLLKYTSSSQKESSIIYTPLLKRILYNSGDNVNNILISIIEEGEGIGISILNSLNVDIPSLYKSIKNESNMTFGINLNENAGNNIIIGRDSEINEIIEILSRKNKCNPLLIGEAGVGKTAIVEGLANRIVNRNVPEFLLDSKIISVSMSSLVSGTKYRGEFEEKLESMIKSISNDKNIILFIDEIHTIVGAGGAEGSIDASNILKPYLARNSIKLIGSTTISEYYNTIYKDKALDRRFTKVTIKEPDIKQVKNILKGIKKEYESFHNIILSDSVLEYIAESSINISNKKEPDRSIELLDTVCAKASIYLKEKKNCVLNKRK